MDNPRGASKLNIGGIFKGIGDVVTGLIPGEWDDQIWKGITRDSSGPANSILPGSLPRDVDGTIDFNPFPDADDLPAQTGGGTVNGCNLQVMVQPQAKTIHKAPRGYVIVQHPQTGQKVAMLKSVARSCGLWKPRQKPIMTAADARTLRRAASLTKKVDRVAKMANSVCGKAPLRRVRGKR